MTNDSVIPCCLALDATDIQDDVLDKKSGITVFQVQPFNKRIPDFVMHYTMSQHINDFTKEELAKCIKTLEKTKFLPIIISSDGDRGSDILHTNAFLRYKNLILEKKSLKDILDQLGDLYLWPISDFFHLLKNLRTRLFKGDVYFSNNSQKVDIEKLNLFVRISETLTEKSDIAKMKDSYAVDLFYFLLSSSCLFNDYYEEAAYTLPLSFVLTAITLEHLTIDS